MNMEKKYCLVNMMRYGTFMARTVVQRGLLRMALPVMYIFTILTLNYP